MLKPLNAYVILKKEKKESKTESGIYLLKEPESPENQATIVAVGPKCDDLLKEGLEVVYKDYSGTKFKLDDEEYTIMDEEDILAIIE